MQTNHSTADLKVTTKNITLDDLQWVIEEVMKEGELKVESIAQACGDVEIKGYVAAVNDASNRIVYKIIKDRNTELHSLKNSVVGPDPDGSDNSPLIHIVRGIDVAFNKLGCCNKQRFPPYIVYHRK